MAQPLAASTPTPAHTGAAPRIVGENVAGVLGSRLRNFSSDACILYLSSIPFVDLLGLIFVIKSLTCVSSLDTSETQKTE